MGSFHLLPQTPAAIQALQGSGRVFAQLADSVDVIVNGDYRADHSEWSKENFDDCTKAGV